MRGPLRQGLWRESAASWLVPRGGGCRAVATGAARLGVLEFLRRDSLRGLLGVKGVLLCEGSGDQCAPAFPTEIMMLDGHGGAFSGCSTPFVSSRMEENANGFPTLRTLGFPFHRTPRYLGVGAIVKRSLIWQCVCGSVRDAVCSSI